MIRTCQQCAAEFDGGANALYCSSCKQLRKREQAKALRHRVNPDARHIALFAECEAERQADRTALQKLIHPENYKED